MTTFIVNARMYAVTPAVEDAWRRLLGHVVAGAGIDDGTSFAYLPYPAPQPLEVLWRRPDVGCVFMCGYPIAMGLADVTPIAAPILAADWAGGRAVYRSDLIVAAGSRFRSLEDTFGGTAGWTVRHSHSGFNAFRHHLLRYRTAQRPTLYARMIPDLITARAVLDAVIAGAIDVGPLDAWWHILMRRNFPELAARVRVVESTATAPIPALVAGPAVPGSVVAALRRAFSGAASEPWFADLAPTLGIAGFTGVERDAFDDTRRMEMEALAAGYPLPA